MPPANGVYSLAVAGTVTGQLHIHTLHFRSTLAGNSVALSETAWMQNLIDSWKTTPAAAYRAIFGAADLPVQLFRVRKVCGSTPLPAGLDQAQSAGSDVGTGVAGEFNGDKCAPWLASVTTERTGFAGRRYRGRFYLGGLYEPMVAVAQISADRQSRTQSYVNALAAAYITPLETVTNFKLFNYSRTIALLNPATPCQDTGADVISHQVRDQLATMKSRKAGSGL